MKLTNGCEWGCVNMVKTQCCLLTHKRSNNAMLSATWGDANIEESEDLAVLGIKIHCNV